ncbi:MAG TPA: hypothetical protein VFV19_07075 [Candidatus Polarisedimenticolaceae bacterium]|nr:hypothetical protein [Candidatus Polarisedimenticolaceae bacterium]
MKRVLLMTMIVLTIASVAVFAADRPTTERFHVAVMAASRKDGTVPDLPPGEAKALADFRKVMTTYRSFAVEAETLLQLDQQAQARLGTYTVEFVLDRDRSSGDSINIHAFQLRAAEPIPMASGAMGTPTYIQTSFTIKRGETIVLGTSTTDQQARVVLVTSLP